jgi:hypothetical protein
MPLNDPKAVWTAPSNGEAQLVCELLAAEGIEAFVVEDNSPAGMYALGVVGQIHKPQVWVDRPRLEEARRVIANYERQPQARPKKPKEEFCYKCGEEVRRGAPKCPACGEILDWSEEPSAPSSPASREEASRLAPAGSHADLRLRGGPGAVRGDLFGGVLKHGY